MINTKIRISGTAEDSIVDGPGLRFTIFTQGCPFNCKGCHNPQTHDYNGGTETTLQELYDKIKSNPLIDGVTFSGGEPFVQANALAFLGVEIHKLGLDIITFTGYTYEHLIEHANDENGFSKLLAVTDYLVDGNFDENLKSYELRFKGSSNQRTIDVKESITKGYVIETIL